MHPLGWTKEPEIDMEVAASFLRKHDIGRIQIVNAYYDAHDKKIVLHAKYVFSYLISLNKDSPSAEYGRVSLIKYYRRMEKFRKERVAATNDYFRMVEDGAS